MVGAAIQGMNAARMSSPAAAPPAGTPSGRTTGATVSSPPPYFPTTGRYFKNRYYEIDPVGFSVANWFNMAQSN